MKQSEYRAKIQTTIDQCRRGVITKGQAIRILVDSGVSPWLALYAVRNIDTPKVPSHDR